MEVGGQNAYSGFCKLDWRCYVFSPARGGPLTAPRPSCSDTYLGGLSCRFCTKASSKEPSSPTLPPRGVDGRLGWSPGSVHQKLKYKSASPIHSIPGDSSVPGATLTPTLWLQQRPWT